MGCAAAGCGKPTDFDYGAGPDSAQVAAAPQKGFKFPGGKSNTRFKVATFNIENYGSKGTAADFTAMRDEKLQEFLITHFSDVDVLAVQEILDPIKFAALAAFRFECHGYGPSWPSSHKLLVCLRSGLGFKPVANDNNLWIEELGANSLRPGVHGTITDQSGKSEYFYIVNVHLKAKPGVQNTATRMKQAGIIADYLDAAPSGLPQIVTGDFNTHFDDVNTMNDIFTAKNSDIDYIENSLPKTYLYSSAGKKFDHYWFSKIVVNSTDVDVSSTMPCAQDTDAASYADYKKFISDHCPVFVSLQAN
jgi:predicted extracellular nuclease